VGHEQGGEPFAFAQGQQLFLETAARDVVQGGEGLVHQEDLGAARQGAGDGDPHAHSPRKLGGVGLGEFGQAHPG
jgi:hypothetical protein